MIVVACLLDKEAYPWQADWYLRQIRAHGGGDRVRLWYVDRALHGDVPPEHPTRVVSYLGHLTEALRQVAAWVERGAEPAASTVYNLVDGQVYPAPTAGERRGVQPVVTLSVNGGERADVGVGDPVEVVATAAVPPGGGQVVDIAWDLDADGAYEVRAAGAHGEAVALTRSTTYNEPGTYFVTVKVVGQVDADAATPFARLENLARARVVVREG